MSMTSAMAASSRTPSSLLVPILGLPMASGGSGQGALLEAQHLVKGTRGPLILFGGGRAGAPVGSGPHGREGKARV